LPSKRLTITNRRGLHARASAQFVTCARQFDADIQVHYQGHNVPATSIMGLMMLTVATGCEITVTAKGTQAKQALAALAKLVKGRFGED